MKAFFNRYIIITLLNICCILIFTPQSWAKPPAPRSVNACTTGSSATSVGINWNYKSGYTIYDIYRSTDVINYTFMKRLEDINNSGQAKYIDSNNIQPKTDYCYKVKTCDNNDCSDFSSWDCCTTPDIPPPPKYSISGKVSVDNQGLSGVTVSFGGFQTTTNSSGYFTISDINKGTNGYLRASKNDFTFDPDDYYISNIISNWTGKNFSATKDAPTYYRISGKTKLSDGTPVPHVSVRFSNLYSVQSASDGTYRKDVEEGWSGVVSASKEGYSFSTVSISNISSHMPNKHLIATLNTYWISGKTKNSDGSIIPHAEVNFSTLSSVTSASDGTYRKKVNYGWSGVISASKEDYTFASINISPVKNNMPDTHIIGSLIPNEEPVKISAQVLPSQGFSGDNFTFSSTWKDAENDVIVDVKLRYRKQNQSWVEVVEPLSLIQNTNPPKYQSKIQITGTSGTYEFQFKASDKNSESNTVIHTTAWKSGGTFEIKDVPKIEISGVIPKEATINELCVFTILGKNLTSGMGFHIDGCADIIEKTGGTTTKQMFQCTPRYKTGEKNGIVKDKPSGKDLHSFVITILPEKPIAYPQLSLSNVYLETDGSLQLTGNHFSIKESIKISILGINNSSYQEDITLSSDENGMFTHIIQYTPQMTPGKYLVTAIDQNNRRTQLSFIIRQVAKPQILIISPEYNSSFYTKKNIHISWTDTITLFKDRFDSANQALIACGYHIYYSHDNGNNWNFIQEMVKWGALNEVLVNNALISIPEPTNNCLIKIVDATSPMRFAISQKFNVIETPQKELSVNLLWDKSFPAPQIPPVGVAADGVGRIILELVNQNKDTEIDMMTVSIEDQTGQYTNKEMIGKLMLASQVNELSTEANSANQTRIDANTPGKEKYYFWYVAPDDFSTDPNNEFHHKTIRFVDIIFTVNFSDDSSEVLRKSIQITRPPLIFVHGLGGDPFETWKDFAFQNGSQTVHFFEDDRFLIKKSIALDPQGSFYTNGKFLFSPLDYRPSKIDRIEDKTILLPIYDLRSLGYACNQVYYVCHSMGGNVLRKGIQDQPNKYYSQTISTVKPFSNYGKGYVNRVITICTPHNGTQLADVLGSIVDVLNNEGIVNMIISKNIAKYFGYNPHQFMFNLIYPNKAGGIFDETTFTLTGAVRNLQTDVLKGGKKLNATNIVNHLIAGDIVEGSLDLIDIPPQVYDLINTMQDFLRFWDIILDKFNSNYDGADRKKIKALTKIDSPVQRILLFIEFLFRTYDAVDFLINSDLVVPVNSQIAGNSWNASHVTINNNIVHTDIMGINYFYDGATNSLEVGNRVNQLLHSPAQSELFSSVIPASKQTRSKRSKRSFQDDMTMPSSEKTDAIKIIAPSEGDTFQVGDQLNIQVKILDMENMEYLKIYFLGKVYLFSEITSDIISINAPIIGINISEQSLNAIALYEYNGERTAVGHDTLNVKILTEETLQNFKMTQSINYMNVDQYLCPDYQPTYQTFISTLPCNTKDVTVEIDDSSIVSFDNQGFKGLYPGKTFANVTYKNKSEKIFFVVRSLSENTIHMTSPINEKQEIPLYLENDLTDYTIDITESPQKGTIQINESFIHYMPDNNVSGEDHFAIVATDHENQKQTFTIDVNIVEPKHGSIHFFQDQYTIDEQMETIGITVIRQGGSDGTISVDYKTVSGNAKDGDDFIATSGRLEWLDGDIDPKNIDIQLINDSTYEFDESFEIILHNPSANTDIKEPHKVQITIKNDDPIIPSDLQHVSWITSNAFQTINNSDYILDVIIGQPIVHDKQFNEQYENNVGFIYQETKPSLYLALDNAKGKPGNENVPVAIRMDNQTELNSQVASLECQINYDHTKGIELSDAVVTDRTQGFKAT
ncbi:secreted protein containing Na-Ca exchanger/integrin-beta4 domain protein, partial [Candidatus Magnetomorum sp. HK-1]